MREAIWNRCDICGKFIGLSEFDDGRAERWMSTPDSIYTAETYETYHVRCLDNLGVPQSYNPPEPEEDSDASDSTILDSVDVRIHARPDTRKNPGVARNPDGNWPRGGGGLHYAHPKRS